MTLEIQAPDWDRHNHVAGLNQLNGSQPSALDSSFTENYRQFSLLNKRNRIPKGQAEMDHPEKMAT
jgi:hypothetical protein